MQKDEYKKLKRLSLIGVLFTVLFTVMLTGYIREQKKQELETKLSEDTKQLNEFKTRFQQYRMSKNSKEKERYTVLVANYETGLQNKDLVFIEACQKNLKQLEKKVIKKNKAFYTKKVQKLDKKNLDNAYDNELERIKEIKSEIECYMEKNMFRSIDPLLKEWRKLLKDMSSIADNLTIQVKQVETSKYPTLQLYLSIHNINTDEIPAMLEKRYFYVAEGNSSNLPQKVSVSSLKKADNEKQMISLVTAIKSPIEKKTISSIQKTTKQLLKQLSFKIGSQIELINASHENKNHVLQPFTSDMKLLNSKIGELRPSKENNLYDLLRTAIKHTAKTEGSKYIIAFTDGEDNLSSVDYPKIIELAQKYYIPIYVIGIGDQISTYTLERIATQTGGSYRNIDDISLIEGIISTIVKERENLYQVTYESNLPRSVKNRNLVLAYQNRELGGTSETFVRIK